jgi:aryl-alcohol dehydrogenase-like predicted oxidoreductase
MRQRTFGQLGTVSALTLGGGGIGQVWGQTTREESVATVREAIELGITLLDMAPSYGNGEAESVVGEAFGGRLPAGVRITTKYGLGNPPASEVRDLLERSLDESFARLRVSFVDVFFLHNMIVPDGSRYRGTSRSLLVETVRPEFGRLVERGRIGAWGITGIGVPDQVIETLGENPAPGVVQCIANLLDSPGGLKRYAEPAKPRDIIATAAVRGVGVMGIRAVQAGALTDALDRELAEDHPEMLDFNQAAGFRALTKELGESAASLAHRYALSMSGVSTVVLGVKNRAELRECVAAEAKGPLPPELLARIDASVASQP